MNYQKLQFNINSCSTLSTFSSNNILPRFRWYGYKEGFSKDLVMSAISSTHLGKGDYILDPFNGNGTVTLTSAIKNIGSIGIEVNPFSNFISEAKQTKISQKKIQTLFNEVIYASNKQSESNLLKFSTFSEYSGRSKWLFNSSVLNSFEGGYSHIQKFSPSVKKIFGLALIGSAMDNCNATKDGKCLKYRTNWEKRTYNKESFINSLEKRLTQIEADIEISQIQQKSKFINGDARKIIPKLPNKFKLCITSPPYLNSFDYTDIYRPELFLGKFVKNHDELRKLRYRTLRSHVEIKLPQPNFNYLGHNFSKIQNQIIDYEKLWNNQIPIMIQSYFEDMQQIFISLKQKAKKNAKLWIIIGNSAYAETEIPVDLILAEIATNVGFHLEKIEVLRYIKRRKTKHQGKINELRESLLILENV